MGKPTFIIIFCLTFLLLFLFLDIPFLLILSFGLNFTFLSIITYYNISLEKKFSPFIGVFVVFNLLFFIVAPLIQIDTIVTQGIEGGSFIQKFPFTQSSCIRANLYILLFNVIFFISYLSFSKNMLKFKWHYKVSYRNVPLILVILATLTFFIIIFNFQTILFQYQNEFYKEAEQTTVANYLLVQKFLFFIPLAGVVLSCFYLKFNTIKNWNHWIVLCLLIFFVFTTFFLKNPLTEKRNTLGPIYITMIFLFFRNSLNSNFKVVRFMFIVMVLIFPLLTIFTHSRNTLSQMLTRPNILVENIKLLHVTDAFNSLHYDAYPNFLATIDFCDNKPVVYGEQLGPTFLFFVPRSIWHSKPEVTGFKIGNYLMERYGFDFNNLSNPYISEGYINFGLLGIILFAVILAAIFVRLSNWLTGDDFLKTIFSFYFAIYLMYFLRGDLANGFAFIIATYLAIVVFPKVLFVFINHYVKK